MVGISRLVVEDETGSVFGGNEILAEFEQPGRINKINNNREKVVDLIIAPVFYLAVSNC